MHIDISHETFVACVAALSSQQMRRPDLRNVQALTNLRESFNAEAQREIDAVSEPNPTPALLRQQAG